MARKTGSSKRKPQKERVKSNNLFVVLWWHFQKPYVAVVPTHDEAKWIADTRNGVVVEVIGKNLKIGLVVDYYRRDDAGNPMPAEVRPYESPYPNTLVRI